MIIVSDSEEENNETIEVNCSNDGCNQKEDEEIILEKTHNHIALEQAINTGIRIKKKIDDIALILSKDHVGDRNQVDTLYLSLFDINIFHLNSFLTTLIIYR